MKVPPKKPAAIESIAALHHLLDLGQPAHPLLSVVRCEQFTLQALEALTPLRNNFYIISIIQGFTGKIKYGQHYYDFEEGVMSFLAPGQLIASTVAHIYSGISLVFHPDFIRNYPLATAIKKCGYFAYSVHEALPLSEQEKNWMIQLMQAIEQEYLQGIDAYTQPAIIARLNLLLTYADRFYNRQFVTRQHVHADVLLKLEALLDELVNSDQLAQNGLPTVQLVAAQLHMSPSYLSDLLRSLTGQNTQQHIHAKLLEKAKELLTMTTLTIGEIADQLGFNYPQSFNKLFKQKTSVTPLAFRQLF